MYKYKKSIEDNWGFIENKKDSWTITLAYFNEEKSWLFK